MIFLQEQVSATMCRTVLIGDESYPGNRLSDVIFQEERGPGSPAVWDHTEK
jgi:hypothetical protein